MQEVTVEHVAEHLGRYGLTDTALLVIHRAMTEGTAVSLVYDNDPEADKFIASKAKKLGPAYGAAARARSGLARTFTPIAFLESKDRQLYLYGRNEVDQPRTYNLYGASVLEEVSA